MLKFISIFAILLVYSVSAQFTQTVVSVTGIVKSGIDDKNLSASIVVTDMNGKIVTKTRANGKYFITGLKPGEIYELTIDAKGYFKYSYELQVPNTDKYSELSRDFALKPMAIGAKIPLSVIPFDLRHANLRPGAEIFLNDFVKIMRSNPRATFSIEVYPEDKNKADNIQFTQKRAEELKNFFIENRVKSQIEVVPKNTIDPNNPPPTGKQAKGKRYKGSIYLVVNNI